MPEFEFIGRKERARVKEKLGVIFSGLQVEEIKIPARDETGARAEASVLVVPYEFLENLYPGNKEKAGKTVRHLIEWCSRKEDIIKSYGDSRLDLDGRKDLDGNIHFAFLKMGAANVRFYPSSLKRKATHEICISSYENFFFSLADISKEDRKEKYEIPTTERTKKQIEKDRPINQVESFIGNLKATHEIINKLVFGIEPGSKDVPEQHNLNKFSKAGKVAAKYLHTRYNEVAELVQIYKKTNNPQKKEGALEKIFLTADKAQDDILNQSMHLAVSFISAALMSEVENDQKNGTTSISSGTPGSEIVKLHLSPISGERVRS